MARDGFSTIWRFLAAVTVATVLGTACSAEDLGRVAAGLDAALNRQQPDNAISVSEWLLGELEDL